jgi:predicted ATPase
MKIINLWTGEVHLEGTSAAARERPWPPNQDLGSPIRFGPGVTLIRGDNGCGKTVLAELVSLLGHLPILTSKGASERATREAPFARMEVRLSQNDVDFLEALKRYLGAATSLEKDACAGQGSFQLGNRNWRLSDASEAHLRRAFEKIDLTAPFPAAERSIYVEFWFNVRRRSNGNQNPEKDLKVLLANDALLAERVIFFAYDDNRRVCSNALKALIAWNRPQLAGVAADEGPWLPTPRYIISQADTDQPPLDPDNKEDYATLHPPGTIGYVNTDMYDFGSGLDIRESPKELRGKMTRTLVDRLQIVDLIGDVDDVPISNIRGAISDSYPIMRKAQVEAGWKCLFGENHPLKTSSARHRDGALHWSDDDQLREFVSSGENQAFFLLAYLENLHWKDSILVLDEPEIHLSLTAASRLIDLIMRIAQERSTQVIIVTHLPHLYYGQIAKNYDRESMIRTKEHHLAYLIRKPGEGRRAEILEGAAALKQASIDSHLQVLAVVDDLRTTPTPSIFGRDLIGQWSGRRWAGIREWILRNQPKPQIEE